MGKIKVLGDEEKGYLADVIKAYKKSGKQIKEVGGKGYKLAKPYVEETGKKAKVVGKRVMRKMETGSTKKAGSAIEKMYKGTSKKSNKQAAMLREKNRMLQMQLRVERQMQANQLAAQQRSSYETPAEQYFEEPQQQYQEDEYGRQQVAQQSPSIMQGIWDRIKPNPGMIGRVQSLGGGTSSGSGAVISKKPIKRDIRNSKQIGTRYVHGMGTLQKEDITPAPQMSLLGGMQTQQSNILNTPQISFFGDPSKKPSGLIK